MEKEEQLLKKLRKKLTQASCLHFACHCKPQGIDHVVLITLVCDKYKRKSLYIFDNLNTPIVNNSSLTHYIRWILKRFIL